MVINNSAVKKTRVLVAMSGGVDSSVAAALLVKQGYSVTGGFMKNFSAESWRGVLAPDCPWEKDLKDVKMVCKKLKIPFRSFNFEKEYRKKVIDYFFREYKAGRTPNPDIMCNKEIKFGLFLKKALDLGFDYVATGHYARLRDVKSQNSKVKTFELLKGTDKNKDQTYFLYTLNQRQLAHTLFPIGEYTKPEVRMLAKKFGLPNWDKKDSQGVCFIGHINLREFLKQRIPEKAGDIVDEKGKIIGRHRGVWYYTIGQRHGLNINGGPYYVTKKDTKNNKMFVSHLEYDRLVYHTQARVDDIHWINSEAMQLKSKSISCKAKIRYRQEDQSCIITKLRKGFLVTFKKSQFAIASGQAIVFYKGSTVLGGGTIESNK